MTTPSELGLVAEVDWTATTPYLTSAPTFGATFDDTLRRVKIDRGRSDVTQPVCQGRCTVLVANADGGITPLSDSYRDGKPLRVSVPDDEGTTRNLFVGTIAPGGITWSGDVDPVVSVGAQDIVGLVVQTPGGLLSSSTGTDMEAWVSAWFDARSWTTVWPGYDVDTGTADLTDVSLQSANLSAQGLLKTAAESEGGVFYANRDGVLTGDNRHAPRTVTRQAQVQWRFGDKTAAAADPTGVIGFLRQSLTVGHHGIYARVSVSYADSGNVAVESAGSTVGAIVGTDVVGTGTVGTSFRAGGRTLERSTALADSVAASALAQFWLDQSKDPTATFGPLKLSFLVTDDATLRCAARVDIRDRVQVTWTLPDTTVVTRLLFVESISHDITPGRWQATLGFSSCDAWLLLGGDSWGVVGTAVVGTATAAY